jgi:histidine ammonia-lyase
MIPQYTAASLVSQNRQLATPSSIDSIDSSNGQEDHVSMGANGAIRLLRMMENLERILAIEYMTAAQAADLREGLELKGELKDLHESLRERVPYADADRAFYKDIRKSTEELLVGIA